MVIVFAALRHLLPVMIYYFTPYLFLCVCFLCSRSTYGRPVPIQTISADEVAVFVISMPIWRTIALLDVIIFILKDFVFSYYCVIFGRFVLFASVGIRWILGFYRRITAQTRDIYFYVDDVKSAFLPNLFRSFLFWIRFWNLYMVFCRGNSRLLSRCLRWDCLLFCDHIAWYCIDSSPIYFETWKIKTTSHETKYHSNDAAYNLSNTFLIPFVKRLLREILYLITP